jgi:sulfur dioxygenase
VLFRSLRNANTGEVSYVLADLRRREAVLVDPHGDDTPLLGALLAEHQLALRWILRTHHHSPHPAKAEAALNSLDAPIVQSGPGTGTHVPYDGEALCFGEEQLLVMHTPGHTAHCLSFQWRDRIYCGGLLDMTQCPYQPYAAEPGLLWDTRQRLLGLPSETLLFSGHARDAVSVSSLMDQRRVNPYFGQLSRDGFLQNLATLRETTMQHPSTPFHHTHHESSQHVQ